MSRLNALFTTDPETRPHPETLPIRKDPPGAKEAILLLHGFTGHPGELSFLANQLAEAGYAVYAPRYPGHGTCRADFFRTKADDWARRAFDAYMELRAQYEVVQVIGHSMGGLLASAVAATFVAPKVVLLAPAFAAQNNGLAISPLIAPFRPVIRRDRPLPEADERNPVRKALHNDYWADDLVVSAVELHRLMRVCRKNLPRLKSRTFVIVGEEDPVVPPRVADYVGQTASRAASFDAKVIAGAGHLFPFDEHASEASTLILEWLGPPRK